MTGRPGRPAGEQAPGVGGGQRGSAVRGGDECLTSRPTGSGSSIGVVPKMSVVVPWSGHRCARRCERWAGRRGLPAARRPVGQGDGIVVQQTAGDGDQIAHVRGRDRHRGRSGSDVDLPADLVAASPTHEHSRSAPVWRPGGQPQVDVGLGAGSAGPGHGIATKPAGQ